MSITAEELQEAIEWLEYGADDDGGPDASDGAALVKAANILREMLQNGK